MAERVIITCDVCDKPAVDTIPMKVEGRPMQKDVCEEHYATTTEGARKGARGRRRGEYAAS